MSKDKGKIGVQLEVGRGGILSYFWDGRWNSTIEEAATDSGNGRGRCGQRLPIISVSGRWGQIFKRTLRWVR